MSFKHRDSFITSYYHSYSSLLTKIHTENGCKKSVLNNANVGATSLFTTVGDLSKWAMNFENIKVGNANVIAMTSFSSPVCRQVLYAFLMAFPVSHF